MSDVAIHCESLGKRYQIGRRESYRTLRETLTGAFTAPWRRQRAAAPDSIWALDDVSFEVKRGEVVGIIGRNGAGKSTLLKILSRITEPTRGYAEVRGRVGSLLEVGTGFHSELTGRENIFLNGAILGMKRAEIQRKFDEIVAFADVEQFLDTPVKRYSSGMYLRLAFAVAAHMENEILLVDEVLAVGDAEFQKKCLGKMEDVGRGGRTVLFVSHSMPSLQRLCTRGILVEHGRIAYDGNIDDAVRLYLAQDSGGEYIGAPAREKPVITYASADWKPSDGLTLQVSFEAPRRLTPPTLGFVIFDAFGTAVYGSNTLFEAPPEAPRSEKSGTFRVRIDTGTLRSGSYQVSFWLSEKFEQFCHLDRVLAVEIGVGGVESLRPSASQIGSVRLPTEWSFSAEPRSAQATVAE